jgi:proteasome lid subunit RPN8/RPN11
LAARSVDYTEEVEEDCVDLKEAEKQGKEVAGVHS